MEAALGGQVLKAVEEASLQEVLDSFRVALGVNNARYVKITHLDQLDQLAARHFRATQATMVSVCGRSLPLLYKMISTLVSPPHLQAVYVVDLDGGFDATRLTCADADLRHVYVQRPARGIGGGSNIDHVRSLVAEADDFMLYGGAADASLSRQWWGTIVLGGLGAGDFIAGWKGWLRIDREYVRGFPPGTSVEEALERRAARQEAVEAAGWAATSQWGDFVFHEE